MTGICIICEREHSDTTIEHIIPRSLGNIHYILPKGKVCSQCNHRFSKYENRVLSSKTFLRERSKLKLIKPTTQILSYKASRFDYQFFVSKIAYEAIYKSQSDLMENFDLSLIKKFILEGKVPEFFEDKNLREIAKIKSIPRWLNAFRLKNSKIWLYYIITNDRRLFVRFQFSNLQLMYRIA